MHGWQRPQGSEPERTYWLRRALVIAAAVFVLLAVIGALARLVSPPTPRGTSSPSQPLSAPSTSATATTSSTSTSSSPAPATAAPDATSASPSASPTPGPCGADDVQVALSGDRQPRSGETAQWSIAVTNVSETPCRVEATPDSTWVTVTSGSVRVWSTQDCGEWLHAPQPQWLEPGKAVEWAVSWPTRLSTGGCTVSEQYLKPGTYVAHARYGDAAEARLVVALRG